MVAFIVCSFHFTGSFHWSSSFLYRVQPHKRSGWLVSTAEDTRQWRSKPCTHQVDFHLRRKMFFSKVRASVLRRVSHWWSRTLAKRWLGRTSFFFHRSLPPVPNQPGSAWQKRGLSGGEGLRNYWDQASSYLHTEQLTCTGKNFRSLDSLIRRSSGVPVKGPFPFNFDMWVNKLTKSLYKTGACSCTTVLRSLAT